MTRSQPSLLRAYVEALRRHAHQLIAEGYERMDKAAFVHEEEPAITGGLVREMRAFLESGSQAPTWASYYSIHDDPPLETDGRRGRSRPRVDIEFERISAGKRPRLRFEAKRLCSSTSHTVAAYLGRDGLGCFLTGRYPTTHGEAGMLGYVQSGNEAGWTQQISFRLNRSQAERRAEPRLFAHQPICPALPHTYISQHEPPESSATVVIHHVLLRFTP